jgi:uncharacterized membrane protein YfcA
MTYLALLLASASALLVGLSKTGLPGVSILAILLMTEAYPDDARASVAAILPVLLVGDVFAVAWFRRHADWRQLAKLLPYVLAGMLPGVVVLMVLKGNQLRPVIGLLVLGMLAVELCRQRFGWERMPHRWWFTACTGLLAGFTTFVANAAMPVMSIYFTSLFNSASRSAIETLRLTTLPCLSTKIIVGTVRIPSTLAGRLSSPPSSKICCQGNGFSAR